MTRLALASALAGALLVATACGSDTQGGGSHAPDASAGNAGAAGAAGASSGGSAGSSGGAAGTGGGSGAAGSAGSDAGSAGSAGSSGAAGGPALVAATVNMRCLLDDWDDRKGPLADGIAAVDPDLLALQEVCASSSQDNLDELLTLVSAKTGKAYQSVRYDTHFNPLAFAQEGIAVVTPHPITYQENVDLPDGFFNRGAIVTRVQTPAGTLLFTGTHLDFGQATVRQQELAAARAAIEAVRQPNEVSILAGDMNENPPGACIQDALAAGYVDPWALLHPSDPGLTSPAENPQNRIDYVLVSDPASSLSIDQAVVFLDQPVGGVWPSDHRGVWAGLTPIP